MTPETLRLWVQAETDRGLKPGLSTDEKQRLEELERENRDPNENTVREAQQTNRSSPTGKMRVKRSSIRISGPRSTLYRASGS